jgi:hypothetical protein
MSLENIWINTETHQWYPERPDTGGLGNWKQYVPKPVQPNPKVVVKWKHKEKGNIVRVAPWYEIVEPVLELSGNEAVKAKLAERPRGVKFGALVQVGWLLEQEHGIFIGVHLDVADQFELYTEEEGK